ncbi:MAG: GAF domain-containing protein [Betaproteobacteria bacterium]|nr:GAF domain-containing protein [Betaproteobacteria bacterium]
MSPESRDTIIRIVAVYVITSLAWLIVSDLMLADVAQEGRAGMVLGLAKGFAFVAVTSVVLAFVLSRHFRRLAEAEAASESTATRLAALADTLPSGLYMTDAHGNVVFTNRALLDVFDVQSLPPGMSFVDAPGWVFKDWSGRPIPPEEMPAQVVLRTREPVNDRRYLVVTPGKRHAYVSANATPVFDDEGRPTGAIVAVNDLTRLQLQRAELERRGRVLAMVSAVERALTRGQAEQDLMNTVCRAVTDEGGYRLAAIGIVGDDPARTVRIMAAHGVASEVMRRQRIEALPGGPHGGGASGRAIRERRAVCVPDIAIDPAMAPWREQALAHGMHSMVAVPLEDDRGVVFGVLSVFDGRADAFHESELALIESLARDLAYGIVSGRANAARREAEARYEKMLAGVLQAMARLLEIRDPYTAGHEMRAAQITVAIATEMGLYANTVEGLRIAAELHDIGKLVVPAEILSRPSRLTETELEIVKQHVSIGEEVLGAIDFPWPIALVVGQHHERLDGSGYPRKLTGEAIRLESRILAVADVYESVTSHRPYRPGRGHEDAMKVLRRGEGREFDAGVVEALDRIVSRHGGDAGLWVRYDAPEGPVAVN